MHLICFYYTDCTFISFMSDFLYDIHIWCIFHRWANSRENRFGFPFHIRGHTGTKGKHHYKLLIMSHISIFYISHIFTNSRISFHVTDVCNAYYALIYFHSFHCSLVNKQLNVLLIAELSGWICMGMNDDKSTGLKSSILWRGSIKDLKTRNAYSDVEHTMELVSSHSRDEDEETPKWWIGKYYFFFKWHCLQFNLRVHKKIENY